MKKNKKKFIFGAVFCIFILILVICLSDKKMDLESNIITKLYGYLGEVDIYHCGGLITYNEKATNKDNLKNENKLCMAYYLLDSKDKTEDSVNVSGKNQNDTKICKVGENTTITTSSENDTCNYSKFSKNSLNKTYKTIYGEEISSSEPFYISSGTACYLEGDTYYCGTAETFTYSLATNATIYRLKSKAVKKINGDIEIYDYFLKVSEDGCYLSNDTDTVSNNCTKALKDNKKIDAFFVKKYGSVYKHTFKKSSKDNYYWVKSELK